MRRCLAAQRTSSPGHDYIPRLVQAINEQCGVLGTRLAHATKTIAMRTSMGEPSTRTRNKFSADTAELMDQLYYMHDILQTGDDDELNIFLADNILFRLVLPIVTTLGIATVASYRERPAGPRCRVGQAGGRRVPAVLGGVCENEPTGQHDESRGLSAAMCYFVLCQVFYIFGDRMLINATVHQLFSCDLARGSEDECRQRAETFWRLRSHHRGHIYWSAGPNALLGSLGDCAPVGCGGVGNSFSKRSAEHPHSIVEWEATLPRPGVRNIAGSFSLLGALSSWYRRGPCRCVVPVCTPWGKCFR